CGSARSTSRHATIRLVSLSAPISLESLWLSPSEGAGDDDGDPAHRKGDDIRDDEGPVTVGQAVADPERESGQEYPEVPQRHVGRRPAHDHPADLQDGRQGHHHTPDGRRDTENRCHCSITSPW